jgi:hypothetical protein
VKKLLIAKKCLPLALGLAGFVAAGTVPVFAQSSGTWAAGISTRNARPGSPRRISGPSFWRGVVRLVNVL